MLAYTRVKLIVILWCVLPSTCSKDVGGDRHNNVVCQRLKTPQNIKETNRQTQSMIIKFKKEEHALYRMKSKVCCLVESIKIDLFY